MQCNSIKKNVRKVCVSNLDKRIDIQTSSISPNNSPNQQSTVSFTTIASAWAMIKTSPVNEFINGVNVQTGLNTDFYIRYNSAIDFERKLYISYSSNIYEVVSFDNIDKENDFIRIRTIEKGLATINVNKR